MKSFVIIFFIFFNSAMAMDGKISFLKGNIKVNGKTIIKKMNLSYGDTIQVGKKSLLILKVNPNTVIKLKANSKIILNKPKQKNEKEIHSYVLKYGDLFIKAKSGKKRSYRVITRNAVMGVRGTNFFVSSAKDKKNIWMCVNEGKVAVSFKDKPDKNIVVKAGEGVVINSNSLPEVAQYSWTKELNWETEGNFKEIEDKTNIQNINYNLKNFHYD